MLPRIITHGRSKHKTIFLSSDMIHPSFRVYYYLFPYWFVNTTQNPSFRYLTTVFILFLQGSCFVCICDGASYDCVQYFFLDTFYNFINFCSKNNSNFHSEFSYWYLVSLSVFVVSRFLNWWTISKLYRSIFTCWPILCLRSVFFVLSLLILRLIWFAALTRLANVFFPV